MVFAIFNIDNDALNTAANILALILIIVWASLVFWTFADARRRIDDPMLVGCATLAALFPFVGTIIYAIVRPPEYLDDVRLRELEMQAAEARLVQLDFELCPHCEYEVRSDYLRCPSCMRRLKESCSSCQKAIDPAWRLCPYCEAETGATPQSTGARRRLPGRRDPNAEAEPVASANGTAAREKRKPAATASTKANGKLTGAKGPKSDALAES